MDKLIEMFKSIIEFVKYLMQIFGFATEEDTEVE